MQYENIKQLTLIHQNGYLAEIDTVYILSVFEDDDIIRITIKDNFSYAYSGSLKWKKEEPFDKDEITSVQLEFKDGKIRNIGMPFRDVSANVSFCINEKSEKYTHGNSTTIEWEKDKEKKYNPKEPLIIEKAADVYNCGDKVEIIADCPLKGLQGELTYVSEDSLRIEVRIGYKNFNNCTSYFDGYIKDIQGIMVKGCLDEN